MGDSSFTEEVPIGRIRLIDVSGRRKKGVCLPFRKKTFFFVSREGVSHDISFFVFNKGWQVCRKERRWSLRQTLTYAFP